MSAGRRRHDLDHEAIIANRARLDPEQLVRSRYRVG